MESRTPIRWGGLARTAPLAFALALATTAAAQPGGLPPPPVPPENPITEAKRVLGKILFWDEQLSADNTVACATCHTFNGAGSDRRLNADGTRPRHPGIDGVFNTPDDSFGSPGVARSDQLTEYVKDTFFNLRPQVTTRAANSPINAAFSPELFWDGRARSQFIDPETGQVRIAIGGALESQAVAPPLSNVEMGHDNIDWAHVTAKITAASPLVLATALPTDVAAVLASRPTYPQLFAAAFGDGAVTASRIAFALATYQRTLISNQTPFDLGTMTPQQQQGFNIFNASNCNACHAPPQFTGQGFRNIGLRPVAEDIGRQAVTGNPADRGRFKVPGLRNVGLKNSFMHNGMFTTLGQVIGFYARAPGAPAPFPDNRDPVLNTVNVPPQAVPPLTDFLVNGLLDPRVRDRVFPFDQPTLYSQRPADQPSLLAGGSAGSGGFVPLIVALDPALVGSPYFRIGLDRALGGATARLVLSGQPPIGGVLAPDRTLQSMLVKSSGPGNGHATMHLTIDPRRFTAGQVFFAQWLIDDPAAPGGQARSNVARVPVFCGGYGCPPVCRADFNQNGEVSVQDIFDFLAALFQGDPEADADFSISVNVNDLFAFLAAYFSGCP